MEATSEYCENELKLVQAESSVPSVSFELSERKNQVIAKLNPLFPPDDCGPYFFFGWSNKYHPNLKLTYYDETRCMIVADRLSTRIAINKQGQILLENETLVDSLEQISSTIAKGLVNNYLNNDSPGEIILSWQAGTQIALLDSVIDQSVKGYLKAARIASTSILNKDLCDLEAANLKKLKEAFPFIFIINHTRKENPVPTPAE
ncbi:hypothetical protein [Cesiribacter sp. SM1]|uniref:hypothetical protein n=1 Tax=Cesiribacter sp. SM1 TaxID=2861196 RepID=UPI001CD55F3F|nr:hypothetical protein [Cesiribacter sp. SM1]